MNDNKKKVLDPAKKRICRHCGNNDYQEKYGKHLKSKHAEYYNKIGIFTNRHNGIFKNMNLEEINELLNFARELMEKRKK